MYKPNCGGCLWRDKRCPKKRGAECCENYDPLDETEAEEYYIEIRRDEFYKEWLKYIEEE